MLENFYWIILIPLWLALIIISAKFAGYNLSKKNTVILSTLSTILTGLYSGYCCFYTFFHAPVESTFNFIKIGNLEFNLGIYIDSYSSIIGLTISVITFAVYIYSAFYMRDEKDLSRFYALLNIFNSTMLGFIFSPNLFQSFIFWELIGVASYLLIGYWYKKQQAANDAKRTFLIHILGDMCFLAGFIIVSYCVTDLTQAMELASLPFSELKIIVVTLYGATTPLLYTIVCLLFIVAALIKSAQFPANSWLINAMSAPTPVSALIHSSTLVLTGAFLLIRLFPMIAMDRFSVFIILCIGLITAIITSIAAMVQTNIKRILAYSTSSQIGLVFVSLGLYSPTVATVYLVAHACIKAMLFMCSGVAIKLNRDSQNIIFMGKLRECMPVVAICFIIGALSLSGIGFCGFNAKHMISDLFCFSCFNSILFGLISILTTFYIFRLYFIVFEGKNTSVFVGEPYKLTPLSYKLIYTSIIFLAVIAIGLSLILPAGKFCIIYLLNVLTIVLCYFLYNTNIKLKKIPVLYNIALNGFFINRIYYWGETIVYKYLCVTASFIDTYIIGGVEYFIKLSTILLSKIEHSLQTNNFQSYISYGVWTFILTIGAFISIYTFLMQTFGV